MKKQYKQSFFITALALLVLLVSGGTTLAATSELFFSEYIEGSSNNKALEIYNGTGAAVDLAAGGYNVQMFFNGNASAGLTINLTGTVADGDVFVLAQSSASADILAQADQTNGAGWFNGDDAVVLRKGTTVIDSIGQVGFDPGTEWGSGLTSTADNTLRRKSSICEGDTVPNDVFDPAAEWDGFATNTFDGLGSHTADCNGGGGDVPSLSLNEIIVSTTGTDPEFFEIAGNVGESLDGVYFLEVTSGGTIDTVLDLSGSTIPADGFWVATSPAAESALGVSGDFTFPNNTLTNNSQTYLLVFEFSGTSGNDIDTDDDGSIDNAPWTAVIDGVAVIDDDSPLVYASNVVGPDGTFLAPGGYRCPDVEGAWNMHAFADFTAYTPGAANDCGGPATSVIINEVDSDTPGTDVLEFVELYDGGVGNTALDGLVVVFYNGNGDTSYAAFDLSGYSTDANGYFLLGNADVVPTPSIIFGSNGLQNGADAVALYADDVANFPNGTAVTTDNLIDAIVYDTNDADDPELLVLLNPGQPQVNESGGGDSANHSNQRCPNGAGGARNTDTYTQALPTPGADNDCGETEIQEAKIHEVQGSGATVAITDPVIVEAIVVADFQGSDQLRGFFIQEEDADADADPDTSEGIFVFCGGCATDVAVGDLVQVTGQPVDFFGMSQIDVTVSLGEVAVVSSANPLPTPVSIDLPASGSTRAETTFEHVEGMLVTFSDTLVVSEYFELARYGQLVLTADARPRQFTDANEPGVAGYAAFLEDLNSKRIILDDDNNIQNDAIEVGPDEPYFWPRPGLSITNFVRGGDSISNLTGVMHWSFAGQSGTDAWRVRPVEAFDYSFTSNNPRTEAPEDVGGSLKVASFNVLNYFTTIDSRGADSLAELDRQREKIAAAVCAMDADIVGLIEIENNGSTALLDLLNGANGINANCGPYDFIDTGVIGTDEIAVAFIYRTATVNPVGDHAILDSSVDPRFNDDKNRPALAQTFEETATGGVLTVVVNHLKSKGSACDDVGDPDIGDGQGNCNGTRTLAAEAMVDWLAADPTGSGDADFLIIGDLNAYRNEDPIDALKAGGYVDLLDTLIGPSAYTYLFDGQLGYLDHALANSNLSGQVTGVTAWNINADEIPVFDYNDDVRDPGEASFERESSALPIYEPNAYRSSDHDPVIVGLNLNGSPDCSGAMPSISTLWPPTGQFVPINVLGVTDPDGDPFTITITSIFQDEAVDAPGSGNTAPDGQGVGTSTAEVRAERVGAGGNGRYYHISFTATDSFGNSCSGVVLVSVPKSQGRNGAAIDDGPLFDSTLIP